LIDSLYLAFSATFFETNTFCAFPLLASSVFNADAVSDSLMVIAAFVLTTEAEGVFLLATTK